MRAYLAIAFLVCTLFSCEQRAKRILVFSKTSGYRHESIKEGKRAIITLGQKHKFLVDTTEDAGAFVEGNLDRYSAVVFFNTTKDVLNHYQQADMERFIQAGGGFVGIHAAADTEYDWPWYGKLVGAWFKSHPEQQEATFVKQERNDMVEALPDKWIRKDELYNYKGFAKDLHVLYKLDEKTYKGGENGDDHPIAWYHEFDGGRAFYTGLGHTRESYSDSLFLEHILKGIEYAIGDNELDYSRATTERVPEENRFTKNVLTSNLYEPTEMAVLPDLRVLFLQRRGEVLLFDQKTNNLRTINKFNVFYGLEDGMIGLAIDPKFSVNHWVYIFYSRPDRPANVVSRFNFVGDSLDRKSEKQIIEVATQRETCCHTGGSLAFDAHGNLFISTGDNTSPFESDGYSPSDDRIGRSPFDAQKSSANTNDLRGKILRIHPEADGSYTIPEGNLFEKGEAKTRPEIYVMGNRNPYRISIDKKTGYLYWGEVGPDAGKEDSLRGPCGYDEVNQARKAGFFGWPYFVGKNYAYGRHDFEAKKTGAKFDPLHPTNQSPNNTGKVELPAVSPPFIWYPYAPSAEFPLVRDGGRNAMAGPVFHKEYFPTAKEAFSMYFENKLIIYDWIRNWIMVVTMDQDGNYVKMEPFMEHTTFNNIIDMEFGPDGKLYTLEYGTTWYKQNLDARLSRIDYNSANRAPVVKVQTDKTSGSIPLTVKIIGHGSFDPDGNPILFELHQGEKVFYAEDGEFTLTFDKPGVYHPTIKVIDNQNGESSEELTIIAGNNEPHTSIELAGNTMFFFPNTPVNYVVKVEDVEDGSTADGKIAKATVAWDYIPQGFDKTMVGQGHQRPEHPGKILMASSDCKACHKVDQKSAGPSLNDVAIRYQNDVKAVATLTQKVIKGGAGVWGTTEMSAHPQLEATAVNQMVEYILSLANEKKEEKLPLKGAVTTTDKTAGVYYLTATYQDKGYNGLPSLSSGASVMLRAPELDPREITTLTNARKNSSGSVTTIDNIKHNATATFTQVDLTNVVRLEAIIGVTEGTMAGGEIAVYLDGAQGKLLGIISFPKSVTKTEQNEVKSVKGNLVINPIQGRHNLTLVFTNALAGSKDLFYFNQLRLEN